MHWDTLVRMRPPVTRTRWDSFRHAGAGLGHAFRTQPNLRIHAVISLAVGVLAAGLRLDRHDWLWLVVAMALVWATELLNTSIEALVDKVSPEWHPLAKVSKDVAASAVLVCVLAAVVIGVVVLWPPLWKKMNL